MIGDEHNFESRLEKIEQLVEENNKILHKMRRSQVIASIMRAVYWILALGIAAATYYYLQPYIESLLQLYSSINEKIGQFGSFF